MHIRDNAFHVSPETNVRRTHVLIAYLQLLLQDTGLRETPLQYAMRVQPEMAIVLLGAFSRYINNIQEEDLQKEKTRATLIALRKLYCIILICVLTIRQVQSCNLLFVTGLQPNSETS